MHPKRAIQDQAVGPEQKLSPADGSQNRSVFERTEVLCECPETDDICLDADFRDSWQETISAIRTNEHRQRNLLAETLDADVEPATIILEEGTHQLLATADGVTIGEWPSRAALLADLAAAAVLTDFDPRWTEIETRRQGTALARLRVFLETCPTCEAPVDFHEEDGNACCWSRDVLTVRCTGCEARLLKVDEFSFDDGSTAYL